MHAIWNACALACYDIVLQKMAHPNCAQPIVRNFEAANACGRVCIMLRTISIPFHLARRMQWCHCQLPLSSLERCCPYDRCPTRKWDHLQAAWLTTCAHGQRCVARGCLYSCCYRVSHVNVIPGALQHSSWIMVRPPRNDPVQAHTNIASQAPKAPAHL